MNGKADIKSKERKGARGTDQDKAATTLRVCGDGGKKTRQPQLMKRSTIESS